MKKVRFQTCRDFNDDLIVVMAFKTNFLVLLTAETWFCVPARVRIPTKWITLPPTTGRWPGLGRCSLKTFRRSVGDWYGLPFSVHAFYFLSFKKKSSCLLLNNSFFFFFSVISFHFRILAIKNAKPLWKCSPRYQLYYNKRVSGKTT